MRTNRMTPGVALWALTALVTTGFLTPVGAAPSHLDPSFGKEGKVVVTPPGGAEEYGNALAALPDGSIVVVGTAIPDPDALPSFPIEPQMPSVPEVPFPTPSFPTFRTYVGSVFLLLRFLPDGRLDPGFGAGGRVWTDLVEASVPPPGSPVPDDSPLGSSAAYALAVQPDGKIVVAGATASLTSAAFALARYLPDGTLDKSFGPGGYVVTDLDPLAHDSASAVLVEAHGRILAAGRSGERAALARYLPDGQPDPSFGSNGMVFTEGGFLEAMTLVQDADHRIIAAGQGGVPDGPYDFSVARYLPDGTLDPSFGKSGVVTKDLGSSGEWASGVAFQPDGGIVCAGSSGGSFAFARYLTNGQLDHAFGDAGLVPGTGQANAANASGRAFAPLPDGRLLMAGGRFGTEHRDVAVARYLADGSLDRSFGEDGVISTDVDPSRDDEAFAATHQTDGKLVLAGTSYKDEADPLVFLLRYVKDG